MKIITFITTVLFPTALNVVSDEMRERQIIGTLSTILFIVIPITFYIFFEERMEIKILACLATVLSIQIPMTFLLHESMGVNTLPLMSTTLFVLVPTALLLIIYFKIKDSF